MAKHWGKKDQRPETLFSVYIVYFKKFAEVEKLQAGFNGSKVHTVLFGIYTGYLMKI